MPTPVLTTKLFTPARRPDLVDRVRLWWRLDATLKQGNRLTLVSAPAGFGKTTSLVDWLAGLRDRHPDVAVAWLSLDAGDDDLVRLLTHLTAALSRAGLAVGTPEGGQPTTPPSDWLPVLVNDVVEATEGSPGRRWVLVLDDYHVIGSADVHRAFELLLEHLPDAVRLIVATRADPPWPLARLRSRGQLTEVRAADLRFTPEEAGELLNQRMGLELTHADVEALDERTEGWAAGLQLAGLSLRDVDDHAQVAAFIADFAGSHRFVIDYLADEVLARQPEQVRDFLLRTSVLERLSGDLCDALAGRADSRALLEQLERANLFLVSLDDQRTWYRYHHLFADVLRARLRAELPEEVPALHRSASGWYGDHGLVEDAVRHALAAEDVPRAVRLVEQTLPQVRRGRQDTLLMRWMAALPAEARRRSPTLSITSGWALLMVGDLDGMEEWLADAEAALAAGAEDPALAATWPDTEDLRSAPAMIPVYRAAGAQARGDVAETVRQAGLALEAAAPDAHLVRGAAGGFLGLAAWSAGDVERAIDTFSEAVRSLHAAGNLVDELDSTIVLADMWLAAGRPSRARRLYEQALTHAMSGGGPPPRATADLHVGLAELDREAGDLAATEARLETARALADRVSITENRHRWYLASALLRADQGEHDEAARLLDEAQALHRPGFYPDVRPIAAVRARLALLRGDRSSAEDWVQERGLTTDDDVSYLHEFEHLTLVRLLLVRNVESPDAGALVDALELLERLRARAMPSRHGSLLEIGVLSALVHQALGDLPAAVARLGEAVSSAPEADAYAGLFLDEGPPMLALLRAAPAADAGRSEAAGEAVRRLAERLLAVEAGDVRTGPAAGAAGETGARRGGPVDPLSDRELEVLRLLDTGLTGPEIARRLFVSLNTLRTHTRHIFTKLEVGNRSAAVRRARDLGLL